MILSLSVLQRRALLSVVGAVSTTFFLPQAVPGDAIAAAMPRLIKVVGNRDYYPPSARRHGEEGIVSLQFVVDAEGVAESVEALDPTPNREFVASAKKMLRNMRFEPPAMSTGADNQKTHFQTKVVFALEPCQKSAEKKVIVVCASRIARR